MQIDSRLILAAAIVFATVVGAWMFRWESAGPGTIRNRFTGTLCYQLGATSQCY
jgi:hypothetical protein